MRKVLLILGIVMFAGLLNCFSQTSVFPDPMDARLAYAREEVLNEHFNEAVVRYARVLQTDENKTVCSEYAFALALSGCYDGAIMYLDKVMVSSKANVTTLFYISQVLKLMNYDNLADVFWTPYVSNPPQWLANDYVNLVGKYKRVVSINTDNLGKAMTRANNLITQNQYMQAVVLYEELIESYPKEYLPYIGASAMWESLGYKKRAADYLQRGLDVMGDEKSEIDPDGVYQNHLNALKADNSMEYKSFRKQKLKYLGRKPARNLVYLGMTYMNKTLIMNARYGFRTGNNTNVMLDLGYSKAKESKLVSSDLSFNAILQQIVVLGAGFTVQRSNGEFDNGAGLRAGVSIPLPIGMSSLDAMLSNYYMFKSKSMRYTLSIGYTCYF